MSRFYCEVLVKHIPAPFVCTLTREVLVQLMLDSAKVSSEAAIYRNYTRGVQHTFDALQNINNYYSDERSPCMIIGSGVYSTSATRGLMCWTHSPVARLGLWNRHKVVMATIILFCHGKLYITMFPHKTTYKLLYTTL